MDNLKSQFFFIALKRAIDYLGLYRKDAALISFVTYLAGSEIADTIDFKDIIGAVIVTFVSVNFIYSFNSWADAHIDRLSKPFRPIPSGRIRRDHALFYSMGLLLISLVYPFFLFDSPLPILLCLLLPILGLLYSATPPRMRDRPYASIAVICIGLVTPMLIGYFSNSGAFSDSPMFLVVGLYCLAVVPLKKIEEVDEDRVEGILNLYNLWGSALFVYSTLMLFITLLLICFIPLTTVAVQFSTMLIISTIVMIWIFQIFDINLKLIYNFIIKIVIAESILFVIYIKLITF